MNTLISVIISIVLAVCSFFAVLDPARQPAQPPSPVPAQETEIIPAEASEAWTTLGDVLALEAGNHESTWDENRYMYLFETNDTIYLVTAAFSQEQMDALSAVDFFADDRDAQTNAILAPSPILSVENLSDQIPPQAELDQWIGKSAQEMVDAGWECSGMWQMGDETQLYMIRGKFQYAVKVDGEVEVDTSGFFDEPKDISRAIVRSIEYQSTSYHVFDEE